MLIRIKKMEISIKICVLVCVAVMVIDPISVWLQSKVQPNLLSTAGHNPFQFWLLINSVNWGNTFYNTLFWIFPALLAEAAYCNEYNSLIYYSKAIKLTRARYLKEKIIRLFSFVFAFFSLAFFLNVLVTYMIFYGKNEITEYYLNLVPKFGTFSYNIYQISPFLYAVFYGVMNAVTLGLFSLFCLGVNMLKHFRNKYMSIIVPAAILYVITFVFDSSADLYRYNIRAIIQPRASSALSIIITSNDVTITFLAWIFVITIIIAIAYIKNRDIIL